MTSLPDALRAAAAIGPYFALDDVADGPGWQPFSAYLDGTGALRDRVAAARTLLAARAGVPLDAIDERATASIHFLGVAARLVAPALATAVSAEMVPVLTPATVHWRPVDGGAVPMALTAPTAARGDRLAELLHRHVVTPLLMPFVTAVQREFRLSPQVLWGNVASALAGAASMLGAARPAYADRAVRLCEDVLAADPLAGTGHFGSLGFVRNSCCLFYRMPGGGTCGDCVLTARRPD